MARRDAREMADEVGGPWSGTNVPRGGAKPGGPRQPGVFARDPQVPWRVTLTAAGTPTADNAA